MVSETTTDKKVSWNAESNSAKPVIFEILEPRILLSGDSLLNIAPDPLQDTIDTTPQVVQYAELLEINDKIKDKIMLKHIPVYKFFTNRMVKIIIQKIPDCKFIPSNIFSALINNKKHKK